MRMFTKQTCSALSVAGLLAIAPGIASAVTCGQPDEVAGGNEGSGLGWDVGLGQCNGDFTVAQDPVFPGGAIELGMRAEQRSVGQVPNNSGDYEVQTGHDTTAPHLGRAWWNFQHSIAYEGDINELDALTFIIRTDAGPSVPTGPASMLSVRGIIDDRNSPASAGVYADIYQTSQNPVFGWFNTYDMTLPGAWYLTLAALEEGVIVDTSICIHTPGETCDVAPAVYTCAGFDAPMDKAAVIAKKKNRVLPLKMTCTDSDGNALTASDIAAPIVQIAKSAPPGAVTDPADASLLYSGQGDDGNMFSYNGSFWQFNISTKNFTGTGTYTITVAPGGGDVLVGSPMATFVIE